VKKRQATSVLTNALFMIFFLSQVIFASEWEPITGGRYLTISGIALIPENSLAGAKKESGETNFLIVHDAKGRNVVTARITMKGTRQIKYEALDWYEDNGETLLAEEDQPKDLEALTALPTKEGGPKFLAIQGDGKAYEFEIAEHEKSIEKRCKNGCSDDEKKNPGPKSFFKVKANPLSWHLPVGDKTEIFKEIEGVAVHRFKDKEKYHDILAWSSRGGGKNNHQAQFCWSAYPLNTKQGNLSPDGCENITERHTKALGFPQPEYCLKNCDRRYISDLKVDTDGNLYIVSTITADPDDDGPFDSIVVKAGKFSYTNEQFSYDSRGDNKFQKVSDIIPHKIEALELLSGSGKDTQFVLGADDENLGGFISFYKAENTDDKKFVIVSPYVVKGETPFKISINNKSSLDDYAKIEISVRPFGSPKDPWWKSQEIPPDITKIPWASTYSEGPCKPEKNENVENIVCLTFNQFEYQDKKEQTLPNKSMELEIQIQGIPKKKLGDNQDPKPVNLLGKTPETIVYFDSPKNSKLLLVNPALMLTENKEGVFTASGGIRLQLPLPEKKHYLFFKAYPGLQSEAYKMDVEGYQSRVALLLKNQIRLTPRVAHFQPEYEFWVSAADIVENKALKNIPNNSWEEFEVFLHYPGERNPDGIKVEGKLIIYKKTLNGKDNK